MSDEEPVDIKDKLEEECAKSAACIGMYRRLVECTMRVRNDSESKETCVEELFDLTPCVDDCVAPKLFAKLK